MAEKIDLRRHTERVVTQRRVLPLGGEVGVPKIQVRTRVVRQTLLDCALVARTPVKSGW